MEIPAIVPGGPASRRLVVALGTFLLVALAAFVSVGLTRNGTRLAAIWPANVLMLAMVVRARPGHRGLHLLAGITASLMVSSGFHAPPFTALALAAANGLEVVIGWYGWRLFRRSDAFDMTRQQDLVGFVLSAGLLGPLVSASIAAMVLPGLPQVEGNTAGWVWGSWFGSHALAAVTLGPPLLAIRRADLARLAGDLRWRSLPVFILVAGLTGAVFAQTSYPLLFLVLPALVLAAFLLGYAGVALATVLSAFIAILCTVHQAGPFMLVGGAGPEERMALLQLFIAISVLTTHPIALALAERDRLVRAAAAAQARAEQANSNLLLAERIAHVGHWRTEAPRGQRFGASVWSDEVYRMHGVSPDSFVPARPAIDGLVHPEDRARSAAFLRAAMERGGEFEYSHRVIRPDGQLRHHVVRGICQADPVTGHRTVFGAVVDITDAQEAQRTLQESVARYRLLADNATDTIVLMERDLTPTYVSPAVRKMLGYEPEQASRLVLGAAIHPDDVDGVRAAFASLDEGHPQLTNVHRVRRKDGTYIWVEALVRLFADPDSGRPQLIAAVRDITDRKQGEIALLAAKREAEEANQAKSLFLASMSHEIRTPMNGVLGFADLLLDSRLTGEQRQQVTLLRDAGRSLLAIINDILDISKIEAGKLELEHIAASPAALVNSAVALVRSQVQDKGLALDLVLSPDLPEWIETDPTRLRQVLLNLLSNALKFTETGGITVALRREQDERGTRLRFEVADTGIGIPGDKQHLLFRDFSQVDASTARRYGGTGLGLSVCRRLVEAMGGEIGVVSGAGQGSRFWFTIGLVTAAAPAGTHAAGPVRAGRAARVLVAEDLVVNQMIVTAMLKAAGHQAVAVANGEQAVEAVRLGGFDLVLMDMEMPVMDGISATRAIRALGTPAARIPIVALTANAMLEEAVSCREAGMDDFLSKPIDRDALIAAVQRWARPRPARPKLAAAS
jgi:PAS domain S-box-containing protein